MFLRWLMCTEGAELPMQRLTWATRGPAGGTQRAWYDCQEIDCIERPVLLQPDPGHDGFFYYNHFMKCDGVPALCHCRRCAAAPVQRQTCCLFHSPAAAYATLAWRADLCHSSGAFCRAMCACNCGQSFQQSPSCCRNALS